MCSAPLDDPQYWKNRYSETARDLEQFKEESEHTERLLCRAVIRLALATGGLDPRIDPHLTRIRDLLRKGVVDKRLRAELDSVSDTLLRESKSAPNSASGSLKQTAALLFRFVKEIAMGEAERSAIAALEAKVERGEIGEAGLLLAVLRDVLRRSPDAAAAAEAGAEGAAEDSRRQKWFGRLFGRGGRKPSPDAWVEVDLVRDRLLDMLSVIEIPLSFRESEESIKRYLKGGLRAEDIPAVINQTIDFLTDVRSYMQHEQHEIETFLALLNGRLTDLENQAVGMDAATQAYALDREAEDDSFGHQFRDFKTTVEKAPDLAQLRALATQRLESLDTQFRANREREMERLRRTHEQIGKLTSRLQDLELESNDLRNKLRLAHDMALRDPLTGLPNRKAYDERLEQEIVRSRRFQHPFTLLIWDIDRFKAINDRFGHAAGDKVLVNVALTLAESIRETDIAARYGGEEFATILCGADGQAALGVAEQIRQKIAQCGFNTQGKPVAVTISCGLSEFRSGDTAHGIFERADKALYESKQGGRNRCVLA
jgi:diguanylate cyclase